MLTKLPIEYDFFTPKIIKKVISANKALAELNGVVQKIPNQSILINSLSLQEAKDSSEIESIVTTHDELYKSRISNQYISKEAKEVESYAQALIDGFSRVQKNKLLTNRDIKAIQSMLEGNNAGFRTQPGTTLTNEETQEIIYTPPQDRAVIEEMMDDLEKYINSCDDDIDPLIRMAIIHHQFESIHPFFDGNGRTGRIINILYLVLSDLLDMPVLYLSRFIIKNKHDYYRLLQEVRETNDWNDWVLYILQAVEVTAQETILIIHAIWNLMGETKHIMKKELPNIYSKDLLEILFSHPYTKIDFLVQELGYSRQKASRHLNELTEKGYLEMLPIGTNKYFINTPLFELLKNKI
ncbi:Fic family protein [Candidatus Gracilibacteria bacterium]|nr:Fic family protein [Candidatus Gracilibacteria bacterium]